MDHARAVLLSTFVVFISAQVGSEIAQRLTLPSVVGQIAAGVLVGPSVLGWACINEPPEVFAEIGVVLFLFAIGLEIKVADLKKVGGVALLVGILGVLVPFLAGGAWAVYAGFDTPKAMFVAAAFVATSAGITAKVLQEFDVLSRIESRVILGAAIIDISLPCFCLASSRQEGKVAAYTSLTSSVSSPVSADGALRSSSRSTSYWIHALSVAEDQRTSMRPTWTAGHKRRSYKLMPEKSEVV